ncbi:NAD(P)H-binding protein [Saccharopolyspora dendranthemae]|uniref:Putative NAD(P)-binding protein n=1 Tax=Saccharopolyspora dendranthemae TaxID=1181886 RepID=A0A561V7M5_9PSEU|nr:NAD(P)H-binding protein [Saccharopolyspora dendranthemae]TWG07593.1 putative NAD(P)-binding protein [Saccharopolyspora dendranthemae]
MTTLIDGEGLVKAAAARAGISRFVLVSVFPDAARGGELGEGFEHYMRVKKSADVHLSHTDLDWVFVRPRTLRDEPGDGSVSGPLASRSSTARCAATT